MLDGDDNIVEPSDANGVTQWDVFNKEETLSLLVLNDARLVHRDVLDHLEMRFHICIIAGNVKLRITGMRHL